MSRGVFLPFSVMAAMVIGLWIIAAPARAAPAPRPDIVGQIVKADHDDFAAVVIARAGHEIKARKYEPVYPGDWVSVRDQGVTATIEFRGARPEDVSAATGPFLVPNMNANPWSMAALQSVLAQFPDIFQPPAARQREETTPAPWRGAVVRSSSLLPQAEQTIEAAPGGVTMPVVWQGGRATVQLLDDQGSVLAEAAPDAEGYAELYSPDLEPGRYSIAIAAGRSRLTLPLRVAAQARPGANDVDMTVNAARALKGPAPGRLQALVDLRRLADTNFVAYALDRSIRGGDNP